MIFPNYWLPFYFTSLYERHTQYCPQIFCYVSRNINDWGSKGRGKWTHNRKKVTLSICVESFFSHCVFITVMQKRKEIKDNQKYQWKMTKQNIDAQQNTLAPIMYRRKLRRYIHLLCNKNIKNNGSFKFKFQIQMSLGRLQSTNHV